MIDENMSGTWTQRFWTLALGTGLGSRVRSEAGLSGNDADECDSAREESDDCVSCISRVSCMFCVFWVSCGGSEALTSECIMGEAGNIKATKILRT